MPDTTPSQIDNRAPFDPTSLVEISGAELLQLVAGLTPNTDKGMAMVTLDISGNPQVPDANTYPKWQNYIWIRRSATSVGVYVWNPTGASDATFLKWQSVNIAGIGAGSIVAAMIADNSITDAKIHDVDWSKISGAPASIAAGGAASGDLTGTYPGPSIAPNAVTTAKIGALQITNALLATLSVSVDKLIGSGVDAQMLRSKVGDNGKVEYFTAPLIFTTAGIPVAANGLKVLRVNAGASDYELVAPTGANGVGNVLQSLIKANTTQTSTATAIPLDNTIPQNTEGAQYDTLSITTKSAFSIIHVHFECCVSTSNQGDACIVALFQDAIANALQARASNRATDAGLVSVVSLDYYVASPGAATTIAYKIRFGPSANTGWINRSNTSALFNATMTSFLKIEEIIGTLS